MSFNHFTFRHLDCEHFLYKTRNSHAYTIKTIGLTSKKQYQNGLEHMIEQNVPQVNLDTKTRVKSILGGSAGNLVEWYDWYVYAAFTLYFAHSFFPPRQSNCTIASSCRHFRSWLFNASDWCLDHGYLLGQKRTKKDENRVSLFL